MKTIQDPKLRDAFFQYVGLMETRLAEKEALGWKGWDNTKRQFEFVARCWGIVGSLYNLCSNVLRIQNCNEHVEKESVDASNLLFMIHHAAKTRRQI